MDHSLKTIPSTHELNTIFYECRQCGSCCKSYRKILLMPDEVDFITKMGGHVGIMVRLDDLRTNTLDALADEQRQRQNVYMIHPDDKGCVFLKKVNDKHHCGIYHYRPSTCQRFKCNLADNSLMHILFKDPMCLLGRDSLGRQLPKAATPALQTG